MTSSSSSSSSLNANAQPFKPLPKWPSKSSVLLPHAPVVTRGRLSNFQIKPVYHCDQPGQVRSSHPAVKVAPNYNERINMKAEAAVKKKTQRKVLWVPKKADNNYDGGFKDYEVMGGGKTSLMIKNIPNRIKRHELLQILDKHCRIENLKAKWCSDRCKSEYDFVYLPMDFKLGANLGYAFVNFTTVIGALRFWKAFDKYGWEAEVPGNNKICEISSAAIQGRGALKNNFEDSRFCCHTNGYLPVILSPPRDGWNRTRPAIVGRRVGVAAGHPIK